MWEEVWGCEERCREVRWGVGGGKERCVESGVSKEVCWHVGREMGEV